jgi:hypothetical protein
MSQIKLHKIKIILIIEQVHKCQVFIILKILIRARNQNNRMKRLYQNHRTKIPNNKSLWIRIFCKNQ